MLSYNLLHTIQNKIIILESLVGIKTVQ